MFGFGYMLQLLRLNRVIAEPVLLTLMLTFGLDLMLIQPDGVGFTATFRSHRVR